MTAAEFARDKLQLERISPYFLLLALACATPILAVLSSSQAESMLRQIVVVLLIVIAVIDIQTLKVPNLIIYPSIAFVLLGTALANAGALDGALIGGGATLGVMFLLAIVGRGMLGMGDVKVGCLIGCTLGWLFGFIALGLGFILGAFAAIALLFLGAKGRKDTIALTPFFAAAAIAVLVFAEPIVDELTRPNHFG